MILTFQLVGGNVEVFNSLVLHFFMGNESQNLKSSKLQYSIIFFFSQYV